jgi:hypothetical protein
VMLDNEARPLTLEEKLESDTPREEA